MFLGINAEDEGSDGRWKFRGRPIETFPVAYRGLAFHGRFTPFRHLGFFPEQAPHWDFMTERLAGAGPPGAGPQPVRLYRHRLAPRGQGRALR